MYVYKSMLDLFSSLLNHSTLQFKEENQKEPMFKFEKTISASFQPYLYIYINAEDA